jgi:hypothetical protein
MAINGLSLQAERVGANITFDHESERVVVGVSGNTMPTGNKSDQIQIKFEEIPDEMAKMLEEWIYQYTGIHIKGPFKIEPITDNLPTYSRKERRIRHRNQQHFTLSNNETTIAIELSDGYKS